MALAMAMPSEMWGPAAPSYPAGYPAGYGGPRAAYQWGAPPGGGYGGGGYGGGRGGSNGTVVDKVLPDMVHLIDSHWHQFPPMNPMWHAILGFVIGCLGVVAISGNGMVIYIFTSTKGLRTPSNLLVLNLAFSDFCLMFAMCPVMVINCYYETWVLGTLICDLYGFAGSLFGCTSIWSMVLIAIDRYNVIVKGLAAKPLTNKRAALWLLFAWTLSLTWTIFPFFGWNRYVPEGNMTACGTDYLTKDWFSRSYILGYSYFCYFLPLKVIVYCYWFIVSAVSAHEKNMREQAKKMNVASLRSAENSQKSAEGKLAKIALMTISLWFMAWTPYLIVNYIGIFDGHSVITPLNSIWASLFAKANSCYNPIVYGISHPKYRVALYKKFPCLACSADPEPSGGGGGGGDTGSVASGVTAVSSEDH
ncbi:rhodopsin-like [Thrips palmi]|uniref:Rhodopsin-like n=1 Tax=Thrips palmi TaxID=161013 RepID=A0A6P8YNV8_THRPL|nr:rhodopsin-like [Thrips palmi]